MADVDRGRKRAAFRALVWKEWRQLGLVRWVGAGLCLSLPAILLAAAAAARRGWLPFSGAASINLTLDDVLGAATPIVMINAWAVLALFVVAQGFLADRAAGTETFLLASPVRRRSVWAARLLACSVSILAIVAAGCVFWAAWAFTLLGPGAVLRLAKPGAVAYAGLLILVAVSSGVAAAALVPSPLPAALTGLFLAALPVGLSTLLSALFPYASLSRAVPPGSVVLVLFPAYVWASFRALCAGEPAGRGRFRRAGVVLGAALATVGALFLTFAALGVRGGSPSAGEPYASPTRPLALVVGDWPLRRGWLVDTTSGAPLHDFGIGAWFHAWSPDGRYLVVTSDAGPLGMRLSSGQLAFYDTAGGGLVHTVAADDLGLATPTILTWTATHLVVAGVDRDGRPRLGRVRPADWSAGPIALDRTLLEQETWTLLGPTTDGRLYVAIGSRSTGAEGEVDVVRLHRLDVERGSIALERSAATAGLEWAGPFPGLRLHGDLSWRLAPSGRYWVESRQGGGAKLRVLDFDTGSPIEVDCARLGRVLWLAGDTLVWVDREAERSRLRSWDPLAGVRDLLETGSPVFRLDPSPDRRKLLVLLHGGEPSASSHRVLDVASGRWSEIAGLRGLAGWGGPGMLVTETAEGRVYRRLE